MKPARLLRSLRQGDTSNVALSDLVRLLDALGFELQRVSGSHRIYAHEDLVELVNVQDVNGQAKPYQVRRVIRLIERYDLSMDGPQ